MTTDTCWSTVPEVAECARNGSDQLWWLVLGPQATQILTITIRQLLNVFESIPRHI